MKLILFDIDGTILRVDRHITRDLVRKLMSEVLDSDGGVDGFDLHGKTDRQIIRELCTIAGRHAHVDVHAADMERLILDHWREHLRPETVHILPGVLDTIASLHERDAVVLGLLTGNLEEGARLKLATHDLNRFFAFGAFGSDAEARSDLPAVALARAHEHTGIRFAPSDALIIGDSYRDIECAHAAGMPVLAVATGSMGSSELAGYGPDAVCESLADCSFLAHFLLAR